MQSDCNTISLYVERSGGHFEPDADTVIFWVPAAACMMLVLCWPDLERLVDRDII